MYKIRCYLLAIALAGMHGSFGQKPQVVQFPVEVQTNRKTAFTAHLLAGKVDPGKKYKYSVWEMGRTVSLPYPTPFQTQPLRQ